MLTYITSCSTLNLSDASVAIDDYWGRPGLFVDEIGLVLDVQNPPSTTYCVFANLKPNKFIIAGTVYTIGLYENGKLRATTFVDWNQPEINVQKDKVVAFPSNKQEYSAYFNAGIISVFTVNVIDSVATAVSSPAKLPPKITTQATTKTQSLATSTTTTDFVRQYTLSVLFNSQSGNINPSGGTYNEGKIVTLNATPTFPYAFKSWVGADDNGVNPTKVNMNADRSVSVNFVKLTRKSQIPVQKNGNTNGIATIPINLNQSEWIEGTIDCDAALPATYVHFQGTDGQNIKDLGSPGHAVFQVQASITGTYNIVVKANNYSQWGTNYNISYTIYGLQ